MACGFYVKFLWCTLLICSLFSEGEHAPSFGASPSSSLNSEDDYRRLPRGPLLWNEANVVPSQDAGSSEHSKVAADVSGVFQGNSSSAGQPSSGTAASISHWGSFLLDFSNNSVYVKPSLNASSYMNGTSYLEQTFGSSGGESPSQSPSPQAGAGSVLDALFQFGKNLSQASLRPLQDVMYFFRHIFGPDGAYPGSHDFRSEGVLASPQITGFAQGSSETYDTSATTQVLPESGSAPGQTLTQSGSSSAQTPGLQAGYPFTNVNSVLNQTGQDAASVHSQSGSSQVHLSSAQGLGYPTRDPVLPRINGSTFGNYGIVQQVASQGGSLFSQARGTVTTSAPGQLPVPQFSSPVQSPGSWLTYSYPHVSSAQTASFIALVPSQPSSQAVSGPANGLLYPPGFTYDQGAVSSGVYGSAQGSYGTYSASSQSGGGAVPSQAVSTFPSQTVIPQVDFVTGLATVPQGGFIPGMANWEPMDYSSAQDVGYRYRQNNSGMAQIVGPAAVFGLSHTTEFQMVSAPCAAAGVIPVSTMLNHEPHSLVSTASGQIVVPPGVSPLAYTVSGAAHVVQKPSDFNWQHVALLVPSVTYLGSGDSNYGDPYNPGHLLRSWAHSPTLTGDPDALCLCVKDFTVPFLQ